MITIYKTSDKGMEKQTEITSGCWVNVVDPTTDEIERMVAQGVPQDFMTYPLDMDERPRAEKEDDGTLLVLFRIPFYEGANTDVPYITIPVGAIITKDLFITVSRRPNDIIQDIFTRRIKGLSTAKRNRFLLHLLFSAAVKFLNYLREINKTTEQLEDELQRSIRNNEVYGLLKYQKSLVYFRTALKGNELMLERLQRGQLFQMFPEDEDLLEDVITENQQANEITNISTDILAGMMDAFASIISNNLNTVMKFLASITIILSLPTLVTSFYGMNVDLPLGGAWYASLAIFGFSLLLVGIVTILFLKKDWL